jgi:ABC-type multidrug transport system fused ATPase/permease subunit
MLGLGLAGSQAGHLLSYELRFGAAAQQVQSSGAHAYFPLLARTSLGIVATVLLASLFLIGLARMLAGRSSVRATSTTSFVGLLAALFTIQFACFVGQEIGEALIAHARLASPVDLLLWGALGQLPIAALAATALGWIFTRFETAVDQIRSVIAVRRPSPVPIAVGIPAWTVTYGAVLLLCVAGASLSKRGPPSSFPIGSY